MVGLLGNSLPPGLAGFVAQRQLAGQDDMRNMAQVQGLLGIQQAQMQQGLLQQQMADKQRQQAQIENFAQQLPEADRAAFMVNPNAYIQEMNKKYVVGGALVGGRGGAPVYEAPVENKIAPNGQVYNPRQLTPGMTFNDPNKAFGIGSGGVPVPNKAFQNFELDKAARGAARTKVEVNPALDPFKNEKSLRDEFRANPVIKSADEMAGAFRLIDTAYKNPTPANDLAMATKYMKILDPTSVVRESELALALGSVGLIDKVYNYANLVATGEKLTPTQRKDFYESAKSINDAFQKQRGEFAGQYKGIARQYGLKPENVTLERSDGSSIFDQADAIVGK